MSITIGKRPPIKGFIIMFINGLLPIIISLVAIDHILRDEADPQTPDFGLIELNTWLTEVTGWHALVVACLMYGIIQVVWAVTGHAHRMTLITAVI